MGLHTSDTRVTGYLAGREASLSALIVADVREALFAKRLKPGDVARHGEGDRRPFRGQPHRRARCAENAPGARHRRDQNGPGRRRARRQGQRAAVRRGAGDPARTDGRRRGRGLDAQRAVETLSAELAAEHATAADHARLRRLIADAEAKLDDVAEFTRSCRDFHLAVAEASHNRVLVVQLVSLEHVAWPARNPTLTPAVARRILDVHRELAELIEMRDGAGARRLMDEHVKMIRSRRVAEQRSGGAGAGVAD